MTVYYHRSPNCPYINDKAVTLYFAFKSMQAAREATGALELRLSFGETP